MAEYFGDSLVGTSGINGDIFYVSPDKTTLLLSDGASGAGEEGKVIMSHCCAKMVEEFPFCDSGLSPREYLEAVIWKINNELIRLSQEKKKYICGTLVICIIHNNKATFALEEYEVTSGDIIVLCCDGVSDYLTQEELKQRIRPEDLPGSVNDIIVAAKEAAIKEHGCNRYDDITVIVYRY